MTRAYEEIVDFIATGTGPDGVAAFRASDEVRQRVSDLIAREKASTLNPDEVAELEHYLQIEHFMRLARARARQHLARRSAP